MLFTPNFLLSVIKRCIQYSPVENERILVEFSMERLYAVHKHICIITRSRTVALEKLSGHGSSSLCLPNTCNAMVCDLMLIPRSFRVTLNDYMCRHTNQLISILVYKLRWLNRRNHSTLRLLISHNQFSDNSFVSIRNSYITPK